jgi:hypothetical protein
MGTAPERAIAVVDGRAMAAGEAITPGLPARHQRHPPIVEPPGGARGVWIVRQESCEDDRDAQAGAVFPLALRLPNEEPLVFFRPTSAPHDGGLGLFCRGASGAFASIPLRYGASEGL